MTPSSGPTAAAPSPVPAERALVRLALMSLSVSVVALAFLLPARYALWFDSFTYWELAGSIPDRFYEARTVREFSTGGPYSSAFPPIWPIIIAAASALYSDIRIMYVAGFVALAAFVAVSARLGSHLHGTPLIGLVAPLLLLAFPGIRWELGGGGSMPLALALLAALGCLLHRFHAGRTRDAVALGALAGAMVMLRFDALPSSLAALAVGVALGLRGRQLVLAAAAFALVLSPWIAYSLVRFGTPFVTDNRPVALVTDPIAFVLDYHPRPVATLFDEPGAWLHKLWLHLPALGDGVRDALTESVFLTPLAVLATVAVLPSVRARVGTPAPADLRARRTLLALAAIVAAPFAAYVVTGYMESRYFSAAVWLGLLASLHVLWRALAERPRWRTGLVLALCAGGVLKSVAMARYSGEAEPMAALRAQADPASVRELAMCLELDGGTRHDGVLFLTNDKILSAYRYGALTGWRAAPIPRTWHSLSREERVVFLRRYRMRYEYSRQPTDPIQPPRTALTGCALPVKRFADVPPAVADPEHVR